MTWTPLAERRDGLPLVIAGPILRRVTADAVSVWLALKLWRSCVLKVLNADGSVRFQSGPTDPISLGTFLHIACVTARTSSIGERLQDGESYTYDLDIAGTDLASALAGTDYQVDVGYNGRAFPTFTLPSRDAKNLRIAGGSCRKPHGGGRDALEALDAILAETPSTEPRPQMLLLCGDQIYADDVADALLYALDDATSALMDGWDESIPGLGAVSELSPGQRSAPLERLGFTAMKPDKPEYAKSHLLSLGEYVAMYLFAWSDVLWPKSFPDFSTATGQLARATKLLPRAGVIPVDVPELSRFEDEVLALARFRAALPAVRRALANTPTYMAFDDHEITDDWYISQRWCATTLGNDGARRVIANGLSAYALCQAWGNDPDQFDAPSGNGRRLLDAISAWAISQGGTGNHAPVEDCLLPPKGTSLNPATSPAAYRMLAAPPAPVTWHYTIDFSGFRLVVLDTRTRRQFVGPDDFPLLVEQQALAAQLGNDIAPLTLVVLPAPLVGPKGIERFQLSQVAREDRLDWDCEAPGLQPAFYERFLACLAMRAPEDPDAQGNRYASVILVSGDVHYGYVATIDYGSELAFEEIGPGLPTTLRLIQVTASALKNEGQEFALTFLGNTDEQLFGLPEPSLGNPPPVVTYGYGDAQTARATIVQAMNAAAQANPDIVWLRPPVEPLAGTSAFRVDVSPLPEAVRSGLAPQWQHELKFIADQRGPFARGPVPVDVIFGKEIVAHNNLGDLRFDGDNLRCDLWWQPTGLAQQLMPATRYRAPLRVIPRQPDPLATLRAQIAAEASAQSRRWEDSDGSSIVESSEAGKAILVEYWRPILGRSPHDAFSGNWWSDIPWSAAFIIFCARQVSDSRGIGELLDYHITNSAGGQEPKAAHMLYSWHAYRHRQASTVPKYWCFPATESVEMGDIVVKSRGETQARWAHVQATSYVHRNTHGDIVVEVDGETATVIGGNLSSSVERGTYALANGLIDRTRAGNDANRVFAILKPRLQA